jgi:hypothetical protein
MVLAENRILGNMPENFQPFFCYETKIKNKNRKLRERGRAIGQNMNLNSHLPSIKVKVCCSRVGT